MFRVRHKVSGEVRTVYAMDGLYFMVWDAEARTWCWVPISEYEPVENKNSDNELQEAHQ